MLEVAWAGRLQPLLWGHKSMLNQFWIWQQSRTGRTAWNPSDRASNRAREVLACRDYWFAGPLLLFVLTACAAPQGLEPLKFDPPSTQAPRDLALHIIEVDDDGEGDDIDMRDIVRIETSNYQAYDTAIPPCEKAEEADRKYRDEEIVLREQFVCVIENAIRRHKIWVDRGKQDWPCGTGNDQPLCLVFYFNGGLNSRGEALQTAGRTYREARTAKSCSIALTTHSSASGHSSSSRPVASRGRLTKCSGARCRWPIGPIARSAKRGELIIQLDERDHALAGGVVQLEECQLTDGLMAKAAPGRR